MNSPREKTPPTVIYDQGVAWGLEQGLEQGKGLAKLEMVRSLLALRVAPETVAKAANWIEEDVLAEAGKRPSRQQPYCCRECAFSMLEKP